MSRITTLIVISALMLCAKFAFAADVLEDGAREAQVHFADLDLARREGAAILYSRLRVAAESVCPDFDSKEMARAARAKACIAEAIARAVARVNRPVLNAYHRSKLGGAAALRQAAK